MKVQRWAWPRQSCPRIIARKIGVFFPVDPEMSGSTDIRPSVDGLFRDGPSETPRDPRTKRLQTQPERLRWL